MKKLLALIVFFITSISFSQDINMQNGTFDRCSGIFYDSGGEFGNYGSDEDLVITLCPETAGFMVQLNFNAFATQLNVDTMTIYNGQDTTAPELGTYNGVASPGFVTATPNINPSGCLTIAFSSDGVASNSGWAAEISCLEPCQDITAQIDSTVPAIDTDGAIKVCPGDDITFTGGGTFSNDPTGATYEWDFGDMNTANGQTVTHSYNTPGVYLVNLVVRDDNFSDDPNGCPSNNTIDQIVQVATEPDFSASQAANAVLCYGESTTITGAATPVEFIFDCSPATGNQTALPDGNGVSYTSGTIVENCYDDAEVVVDGSQIAEVCLNIEHSYSGDLDIYLESPNGVQVQLFAQAGGGTYFGGADNNDNGVPGVGADYCFSTTATTLLQNANTINAGTNPPNASWEPGTYLPIGNFDDFIGSPINGDWTIIITDNIPVDDGTIFYWSLDFDPSLQPPLLSFTPNITSEGWDADPTITNTSGNVITVTPPDAGQYCYTYRATDDYGCEYTEQVCIDVLPELIAAAPNNLVICDPGAAPYIFDLELNTPVVTASASNAGDLVVTYHNSQTDAENDTGAISGTNNYSGTDGETIFVRVEYLTSGCNEVFPFTLNLSGQPVINPVSALELCDDSSNDGFEEFNLNAQTAGILGGQDASSFEVTYHLSFADADADVAALPLNYTNTANPQPIFVRIETIGDSSCYNASANPLFNLVVIPREDATFNVTPTCDGATVNAPLATPGGVFEFTGFPGPGVSIDPNTGEVTGATSGLPYEVRYTTPGVCPSVFTLTFNVLTEDNATFNVTPTCDGGTASITGDLGGIFSFNPVPTDTAVIDPSTGDVTNATPGSSYTIEYMTSGACPASSTQVLTVLNLDDPSFSLTATCDGATATITGDTGGTFGFNPAPTDAAVIDTNTGAITSGTSGATYSVEYTTANSCPQSSIEAVTVLDSDDASFTVAPTCDGGVVTIAGTVGGIFDFDTVPTDTAVIDSNTGEVTNASSGATYSISYTTLGVCPDTEVVTFNALPIDDASFIVNPTCDGGETTITGITGGTFSFDVVPTDLAVIDANTGNVTNGTPGETYTIEYVTFGACPNSSIVVFTANPLPSLVVPLPLAVCDDGVPDGLTEIDLSIRNEEISGNNPLYSVSYYLTPGDADTATDPLPTLYTNTSNGQIVHVRVEDTVTGCYDTTTLELVVEQAPVANVPQPLRYCDPDNDGAGMFMLADADNEITGGAPGLTVSYHDTMENAENNADALDTTIAYGNTTANMQTLYARVESSTIATDCATIVELVLIVEPTPQIEDPTPLEACDDPSADGFAEFDLTSKAAEVLNGLDATQYMISYYRSEADAEMDNNRIGSPGAYTNTVEGGELVWIRVEDGNTVEGCYKLTSLELIVHPLPVLTMPMPFELCDVDNPGDEEEAFDLEDVSAEILNGVPGVTISYHETQVDADNGTGAIVGPYTNMATAQTIFVRGENNATGCYSTTTLTIRVNPVPTPTPSDQLPEMELCDEVNTGDGIEIFDLTTNEILILNGETGVTTTYHETAEDADTGDNPIGDPTSYTNAATPEQQIHVRVTNNITGCYALVDFTIRVNPLPEVVAVTDFIQCELNTDGIDSFDLATKNEEVLNGQDPNRFIVTYHDNITDAESGANALVLPYTNTSNPQEVIVTITDTTTGCSISTQRFNLQVDEASQANADMELILYEQCDDNMETDGDPGNDSVQFDLSTQDAEVLDGQDPGNYMVSYYASEDDANLNVNPLPSLYENLTNPQVVYARVDNNTLSITPIALDLASLTTGLDLDGNGTIDTYDTDGDGVFDLIDVDGDGLSDGVDTNGDGLFDLVDIDGDGTGDAVDLNNDGTFDNQQDGSICFAVAPLTLQVNPLPEFDLEDSYILCVNTNGTEVLGPLVLDTGLSATDYEFEWSYNGTVLPTETGPSTSPAQGGTYSVIVTDISTSTVTNCTNMDSTEVIESEPPSLIADVVTQAFAENHVIEAVATGLGTYEYSLDDGPWQDSGTFTGVSSGDHQVTARDRNGCGIATVEVFVLDYPLYFTPNGDGNHDTWNIGGIGASAKIYIFDRYGKLLKQLSPTGPGWDGTYNGNRMPTNGYWFTVEYDEPLTGQRKKYRANFTLKR